MIPEINITTSGKGIISNWSLHYICNQDEIKYTRTKYSFTKQMIFSVIITPLIIYLLVSSIKKYKSTKDNNLLIPLVFSCIIMIIHIITLVLLGITKEKKNSHNQMSYIIPGLHTLNFSFMIICLELMISFGKFQNEYKIKIFILEIQILIKIVYDLFCLNKYYVGLIFSILPYLIYLISSIFCNIDIILIFACFLSSGFQTVIIYILKRRQKIFDYYIRQSNNVLNAYSHFYNSKKYFFASFTSNQTSCIINRSLNQYVFKNRKPPRNVLDPSFGMYVYNGDVKKENFIKKACFSKFIYINPNLPSNLKEIMNKILSLSSISVINSSLMNNSENSNNIFMNNGNTFLSNINNLFSNLSSNSTASTSERGTKPNLEQKSFDEQSSKKKGIIYYLGDKQNEASTEKKYSIFIYEEEKSSQIIYFGIQRNILQSLSSNHSIRNQLEKYALFTSKITHEIKNPLLAIQGEVEAMKNANINNESLITSLNMIRDYSQYMLIITKDFECIAREFKNINQKDSLETKPFSVQDSIHFCVELIKRIKRINNIKIKVKIEEDVPKVIFSDEIRFKQIIINLLSNSVKFTRFGTVEVKCRNFDDNYLQLEVSDTGFGIKEEELKKINSDNDKNDEGFLFVKSMKDNSLGSGLGLSIIKSLVRMMGKDFLVESEYNKGTTTTFKIKKNLNNEPINTEEQFQTEDNLLPNSSHYLKQNMTSFQANSLKYKPTHNSSGVTFGKCKTLVKKWGSSSNKSQSPTDKERRVIMGKFKDEELKFSNTGQSDSTVRFLETSNDQSLIEHDTFSQLTKRKSIPLRKPVLPKEIYKNLSDGKSNPIELVVNDYNRSQTNFNFVIGRFSNSNKDYKDYKYLKSLTMKATPNILTKPTRILDRGRNSKSAQQNRLKYQGSTSSSKTKNLINDESEKMRILVVEDEKMLRKATAKGIRDYANENHIKVIVEECDDGFECLYKIYTGFSENHKYKCIITDDSMKFLNGTFMAYIIQILIEDKVIYPMHIYLATSNDIPINLFKGITLFDDVFGKPLTRVQLTKIFENLEKEKTIPGPSNRNEEEINEEEGDDENNYYEEEDNNPQKIHFSFI